MGLYRQPMGYYREFRLSRTQTMVVLFVTAAVLVCFEGHSAKRVLDARDWDAVGGRITTSKIEKSHSYSGGRSSSRSDLRVQYKYSYGGKARSATRINFGGLAAVLNTSFFDWGGTLAKYPKGKSVTVYVDPKRPDSSVLERDFPKSGVIGLGAGVTALILIGGMFLMSPTQNESRDGLDSSSYS